MKAATRIELDIVHASCRAANCPGMHTAICEHCRTDILKAHYSRGVLTLICYNCDKVIVRIKVAET